MIELFNSKGKCIGVTDLISLVQGMRENRELTILNPLGDKSASRVYKPFKLEDKPTYISLNPSGGNGWGYYFLVARNVSCNELVERLGDVCLMISDISLQRKPGCLILLRSYPNIKMEYLNEHLLQGNEIKDKEISLIRLRMNKNLYFNPNGFYHCPIAGIDHQGYLESNVMEEIRIQYMNHDFRYQSKVKVINPIVDYREEKVVRFYVPKKIPLRFYDKIFGELLDKMIYLNPKRSKYDCLEHLWNIQNKQEQVLDYTTFSNRFDNWWKHSKLEGGYVHAKKVSQTIHFNERANLDRDTKRKIIAEIVGIQKSIKTQAAIIKLREENPELNKNQMKDKFKYSINTFRRYWDKEIICFEDELERINHKYGNISQQD